MTLKIYIFLVLNAMNTYFDLYIIMCVILLWFVLSYKVEGDDFNVYRIKF